MQNSKTHSWIKRGLFYSFAALVVLLTVYFGIQISIKVVRYFSFDTSYGFLISKQKIVHLNHYRLAFYVHISTSVFILFAGLFQFSKKLLHGYSKLHRNLGKLYLILVLFFSAPAGFVMAFYANGGFAGKMAFWMQSILWFYFSLMAYVFIRKKKFEVHGNFMLRSYSLALAAISLRLLGFILPTYFGTKPIESYITSSWMSWTINLIIAEMLIQFGFVRYLLRRE